MSQIPISSAEIARKAHLPSPEEFRKRKVALISGEWAGDGDSERKRAVMSPAIGSGQSCPASAGSNGWVGGAGWCWVGDIPSLRERQ